MGMLIITLVIVVLISVGSSLLNKSRNRPHFKNADDLMQYSAEKAVSMARRFHGIRLDYSEKSIMDVEEILGTLHEEYCGSHSKNEFDGLARAYGSYIGEVIRRGSPGSKWERDHPVIGEDTWPLRWNGGDVFPGSWCYGRIVNGPEDNVWHKYVMCKPQRNEPEQLE